jgi:hypothetical protein
LLCGTETPVKFRGVKIPQPKNTGQVAYQPSVDRTTAPIVVAILDWMLEKAIETFGRE